MIRGDSQTWASRFRSVDQRLMERVLEVWPKCLTVLPEQPTEDFITENLVNLLSKDAVVRRLGYPEYQYEPFREFPNGTVTSTGKIDFALILDNDRSVYVAYECKRLNVKHKKSRESLAKDYVHEGLTRFVREQYSEGLPYACMLGYVIDGDISFARMKVWGAIKTDKTLLGLLSGPSPADSLSFIDRFITTHQRRRGGATIEVRHAFLPFLHSLKKRN